jgi:hypothetical protein
MHGRIWRRAGSHGGGARTGARLQREHEYDHHDADGDSGDQAGVSDSPVRHSVGNS